MAAKASAGLAKASEEDGRTNAALVANSLGDPICGPTVALGPHGRAAAAPSALPPTRTSSV